MSIKRFSSDFTFIPMAGWIFFLKIKFHQCVVAWATRPSFYNNNMVKKKEFNHYGNQIENVFILFIIFAVKK